MDTRTKILGAEAALEAARRVRARGSRLKVVTGYFDPLLAAHARRLREIAGNDGVVMVAVTDPPRPILPGAARAELVAALSVVDYVILADEAGLGELLGRLGADEVFREEAADERRTQELIRHVHSRRETA